MTDNATMKLQRTHLQQMLVDVRRAKFPKYHRGRLLLVRDTTAVKRARRIIRAHEKKLEKIAARLDMKISKIVSAIEFEILFGTPTKAVKMITDFKRIKFT